MHPEFTDLPTGPPDEDAGSDRVAKIIARERRRETLLFGVLPLFFVGALAAGYVFWKVTVHSPARTDHLSSLREAGMETIGRGE